MATYVVGTLQKPLYKALPMSANRVSIQREIIKKKNQYFLVENSILFGAMSDLGFHSSYKLKSLFV